MSGRANPKKLARAIETELERTGTPERPSTRLGSDQRRYRRSVDSRRVSRQLAPEPRGHGRIARASTSSNGRRPTPVERLARAVVARRSVPWVKRRSLPRQPQDSPPRLRPHRKVDDVGPVVAVLLPVGHQARRDRAAVGLVADEHSTDSANSRRCDSSRSGAPRRALGLRTPRDLRNRTGRQPCTCSRSRCRVDPSAGASMSRTCPL